MERKYIIELTENEAFALKAILGNLTDVKKKELGLNDEMIGIMSDLYDSLPDRRDEE